MGEVVHWFSVGYLCGSRAARGSRLIAIPLGNALLVARDLQKA